MCDRALLLLLLPDLFDTAALYTRAGRQGVVLAAACPYPYNALALPAVRGLVDEDGKRQPNTVWVATSHDLSIAYDGAVFGGAYSNISTNLYVAVSDLVFGCDIHKLTPSVADIDG